MKWNHKRFTGFKVEWNCTNCFDKDNYDSTFEEENKYFIRLSNIVNEGNESKEIWNALKSTKKELHARIQEIFLNGQNWKSTSGRGENKKNMFDIFFETMEDKLSLSIKYKYLLHIDITDQTLEDAVDMFLYMTAPYQEYWIHSLNLYSNWLENLSLRRILGL